MPLPTVTPHHHGLIRRALAQLWAILRLRCPRCLTGKVFRGSLAMNDPCPVCGLLFEREEGYFLGAMYVSYGLACVFLIAVFFLVQWLLPNLGPVGLFIITLLLYLPLVPLVFRYSRVIWMHFDRLICPGTVSATSYEKLRSREFERTGVVQDVQPHGGSGRDRNGSPP